LALVLHLAAEDVARCAQMGRRASKGAAAAVWCWLVERLHSQLVAMACIASSCLLALRQPHLETSTEIQYSLRRLGWAGWQP